MQISSHAGDICIVSQENQVQIWPKFFSLSCLNADQIPSWKTLVSHSHAPGIQTDILFESMWSVIVGGHNISSSTCFYLKIYSEVSKMMTNFIIGIFGPVLLLGSSAGLVTSLHENSL